MIKGGENYLKRALQNKPLMTGDMFRVRLISSPISFAVAETQPDSPVVVTSRTQVVISTDAAVPEKQADSEERAVPDVSYEDIEELEDVIVIAASNRPDMIDKAILRPGRLDRKVKAPIPDLEAREEIFRIHLEGTPLEDVDIEELAESTEGFTGSDIESVTREASMLAMRDYMRENKGEDLNKNLDDLKLTQDYLEKAVEKVGPSLDEEDRANYDSMAEEVKSMVEN